MRERSSISFAPRHDVPKPAGGHVACKETLLEKIGLGVTSMASDVLMKGLELGTHWRVEKLRWTLGSISPSKLEGGNPGQWSVDDMSSSGLF